MDRAAVDAWMRGYFAAWISNDPAEVAALFTEDAVYQVGPFAEPWRGRDEIVRQWVSGRQDDIAHRHEVMVVDGDRAAVRWNVRATDPDSGVRTEMDGVLSLMFAPDGRCREHREWFLRREIPAG
ncbi:MAG TPA: nuclear transport factor 2 family protein [Actinomycetota bacterium]|jgi:uncharacterized protein (TIGR02246 family)|nr:nuclear transport factor 2 family protein [Actinomycetota bacterium]